jgi:hypothetical protein
MNRMWPHSGSAYLGDRSAGWKGEERRWPLKSRRRFDPVDVSHYGIAELVHSQAEPAVCGRSICMCAVTRLGAHANLERAIGDRLFPQHCLERRGVR